MGFTEALHAMARDQRAEADVLIKERLSQLYQNAATLLSTSGNAEELIRTDTEIAAVRAEIQKKEHCSRALTENILPRLKEQFAELDLEEPSREYFRQLFMDGPTGEHEAQESLIPVSDLNVGEESLQECVERRKRNKTGLTEKQMQVARIALRLTDDPRNGVALRDMVHEVLPEANKDDYHGTTTQVRGSWMVTSEKLTRLLGPLKETTFPLSEQEIANLQMDDSLKDILTRISRIPRYHGLTFEEIKRYCGTLNHKKANLLENAPDEGETGCSTLDKKIYLATRLQGLQLASSNDRSMIISFLGLQENRDVKLPDSERQEMYGEIMSYLDAETDVADSLWEQKDEGEQILMATLVRYLNQKARPHQNEPWENLVADILEVKRPEDTSKREESI